MLFEIQALGGKVIASKSAMTTLNRLTTLLPNAKINVQTITLPKIEPDEDDITLAELKEQLEDNMTLAELQERLLEEEEEEEEEEPAPIEWVDEATYHARTCGELRNF
jgi:Tfp pilus assembly protein FimV